MTVHQLIELLQHVEHDWGGGVEVVADDGHPSRWRPVTDITVVYPEHGGYRPPRDLSRDVRLAVSINLK